MTTKTKIMFGASVVLSAAAGFIGGYFIGKNKMKKETDAIINQLNDEINDYVNQITSKEIDSKVVVRGTDYTQSEAYKNAKALAKKNEELKKKYWAKINREGYISNERREEVKKEIEAMSDEEYEKEATRDYDEEERLEHNEELGYETDEHYEERLADKVDTVGDISVSGDLPPYLIDENDYMDPQFDFFSKQEFTYFGDGTLIDDGEDIIPNPEDIVGLDNLIELETGKTDRIYVRNEPYAADYEIVFKEMSYKEFMGDLS